MTVVAENLWSTIRLTHALPNAVQVEVTGVQFQWYFRYPGVDGTYGATRPELVDAAGGNPLGLDPADPHGHDDIVSSVLVLPVDRQVEIRLRAQDVIHGFFIPAMRVMQNATPGMASQIHITPTRVGDYPILCSQLCGLGHYRMHAILRVVSADDYAAWMAQHQAASKEK
jgi:cytochrome c oxidase subunit 2